MSLEQNIINWVIIGGIIGILYSLRFLVVLDRRLFSLEKNMNKLLKKIEREENLLLAEEKLFSRAILKKK